MPLSEGMRGLLDTLFGSVFVVANAVSLQEGVRSLQPAVAILDLAVAGGELKELVSALKASSPRTGLIVLTVHDAPGVAEEALSAGLDGIVLKRFIARDLLDAVETVLRREVFITREFFPLATGHPEL